MFKFITNIFKRRCNQCGEVTNRKYLMKDIGYDDYGYQCLACAEVSGLLEKTVRHNAKRMAQLNRRSELGVF